MAALQEPALEQFVVPYFNHVETQSTKTEKRKPEIGAVHAKLRVDPWWPDGSRFSFFELRCYSQMKLNVALATSSTVKYAGISPIWKSCPAG